MITRITLENYMSHARTVIEPAPGLTVLVGPNNCGKSAVMSALQTICGDHDGDFMVRHGQKSCQVTLETADGHVVTWRRLKGKVSYVIDGREVHRVGKGNLPDGLHDVLQLAKVQHPNGRDEFDVHFGHQKSPIFLIDREGDAAAFFSTASDAEKLIEVQKRHKEKVTLARRQQRDLTLEVGRLDQMLAALSPLDQVEGLLEQARQQHADLIEAEARAGALELLIRETENRRGVMDSHSRQGNALSTLQAPPALEDTAAIDERLRKLEQAAARLQSTRGRCESLAGLHDPPELQDTANLLDLGKRLSSVQRAVTKLAASVGSLGQLGDPPAPQDAAPLNDAIARLEKSAAAESLLRRSIPAMDAELQAIDDQINAWLWANPACPTCGAKTTREALLSGGHTHGAPAERSPA